MTEIAHHEQPMTTDGLAELAPLFDALAAVATRGEVPGAELLARVAQARPLLSAIATLPNDGEPYSRSVLGVDDAIEIMVARWRPGHRCAPHDHGGSGGFVVAVEGTFQERRFRWDGTQLVVAETTTRPEGEAIRITPDVIHDMGTQAGGLSLHLYSPPAPGMRLFDLERAEALELVGDYGAWIPEGDHPRVPFADIAPRSQAAPVIWVAHTTHYRGGSAEFAVAAATMARELAVAHPDATVVVTGLRHKADFAAEMARFAGSGRVLSQLHLISHAGIYGPMFGSTDWPEQFSPHEWRAMAIPFAPNGRAYFHACRTARWFTPFFADVFGVPAFGNHNYTTVSARKDRFAWAGPNPTARQDLYLIAAPGKKSHGWAGSVRKYLGCTAEPLMQSLPAATKPQRSYDRVAELYDRAYADIRVRYAEWQWVADRVAHTRADLGRPLRVLEIGCGNGALLRALDDGGDIDFGIGVDSSEGMLARAGERSQGRARLRFGKVNGPALDVPDDHIDVIISFLSFRYLDWDPVMAEIRRVLAPGGRLWVVDMIEHPVRVRELGVLARSVIAHVQTRRARPQFAADLGALTTHPDWRDMVRHNPIRAEHEYRWYFASRFPGTRLDLLTATPSQRVVAFDSGPLPKGHTAPLTFPVMPMSANSCLGIVDWGIGSVGLVSALDQLAPGLPLLYWADTGVTPYGRMGTDELTARLTTVVSALAQMGATEVVLACNAASTVVGRLGAAPVAVEGIIGHGVACVPDEIAGPVGVVGGRRTIAGGNYRRGLARPGRMVLSRVAQPLSAHIEAGRAGSPQFLADLARIVAPLRRVDALVLACTHYPAASRWFAAALPDTLLIDPAERLAAAVAERHPHTRNARRLASRAFFTTGDPDAMKRGAESAWGTALTATTIRP